MGKVTYGNAMKASKHKGHDMAPIECQVDTWWEGRTGDGQSAIPLASATPERPCVPSPNKQTEHILVVISRSMILVLLEERHSRAVR